MITVLKPNTTPEQRDHLIHWLEGQSVQVHISEGSEYTILGLVGDTSHIDFLIMAFVIFLMIKAINKASSLTHKKKEEAPAAPTTKVCPYCLSEIPIGATKCPHCTSDLPQEEKA